MLNVSGADVALTGEYQGRRCMTLTYPTINRARRVLWVVTGSEKASALQRLLDGDDTIPGCRVRREQALLFADRAAIRQLTGTPKGGCNMRAGIATDHGGFGLKEDLVDRLRARAVAEGRVVFLSAEYGQAERYLRRLDKIAALELQRTSYQSSLGRA